MCDREIVQDEVGVCQVGPSADLLQAAIQDRDDNPHLYYKPLPPPRPSPSQCLEHRFVRNELNTYYEEYVCYWCGWVRDSIQQMINDKEST